MEHSIDPHPYGRPVGLRLQMDVRGVLAYRRRDDLLDQRDDLAVFGQTADLRLRLLRTIRGGCALQTAPLGESHGEGLVQGALGGCHWSDFQPGDETDVVYGHDVRGVEHGQDQGTVSIEIKRQDVPGAAERLGQHPQGARIGSDLG